MVELFANNGDPDQMPHSAAPGLGVSCLPITLCGISKLQWVNLNLPQMYFFSFNVSPYLKIVSLCFNAIGLNIHVALINPSNSKLRPR